MNICSRVISVGSFHKTHPITVGIATASAASIQETIVSDLAKAPTENNTFYIGHPYGIMPIKLEMDGEHVVKGGTVRTARRIMDGYIYIND